MATLHLDIVKNGKATSKKAKRIEAEATKGIIDNVNNADGSFTLGDGLVVVVW